VSETKTSASLRSSSAGTLSDRVQSLRLPPARTTSGASRAAWALVLVLGTATVYLALGGTVPYVPRPLERPQLAAAPALEDGAGAPREVRTGEPSSPSADGAALSVTGSVPAQIALESKGWVIPEQQILVSPQVSGRVVELNFEAGQRVQQGDVLAVLDSTEYQAEYERALAEVAIARERMIEALEGNRPDEIRQAKAEVAENTIQLQQAERLLKRKQDLYRQGVITAQEFEDAQSQFEMFRSRVEKLTAAAQLVIDGPRAERKRSAEAEYRRAEADLSRAKWRLDNTVVRAPITGTILKKNAELGNLVNPVAFNGSFSLCDMADLSKLEVELSIQERDIAKVFKHQRCKVRPEAFPERVYEGYVSRLMPIADRAKSAVPVRVRLSVPPEEEGVYLKPEMGATVTFFTDRVEPPPPATAVASPPAPSSAGAVSQ